MAIPYAADEIGNIWYNSRQSETEFIIIHRDNIMGRFGCIYSVIICEKPNLETATKYLASVGIIGIAVCFCLNFQSLYRELKQFRPDILSTCRKDNCFKANFDLDFCAYRWSSFSKSVLEESIDSLSMEKQKTQLLFQWMLAGVMSVPWSSLGNNDKDSLDKVIVRISFSRETKFFHICRIGNWLQLEWKM